MPDRSLDAIEAELERIGTGPRTTEPGSIGVNDERDGWASLGASPARRDFYWYGRVEEILDRLRSLETGAGPGSVRAEFHIELPIELRPQSNARNA